MTAEQLPGVSVIDPISPAIEKVKVILFAPFELRKWFIIGFCAWLAYLGSGGIGPGFNFPYGNRQADFEPDQFLLRARDFILDNLPWVVLGASIGLIIMIILWLIITWLSSRGRFMFLYCVAQNKAEIKLPWHKFRQQGNSLFLFRIAVSIASWVFFALLTAMIAFFIFLLSRSHAPIRVPAILVLILLFFIVAVPVAIAFALLLKFTKDFVVPIMYLRNAGWTAGWREFWTILSTNKARFTLYIIFQIVIAMAIGAILMTATCITCCCAACVLVIPYIGTVFMLPLLIFKRAYSLCYFRQFGPGYDVFRPEIVQHDLVESP